MRMFDFDRNIDRRGFNSVSYDFIAPKYGQEAISLSIAEMDFQTCPEVLEAVTNSAKHGIYSYTDVPNTYGEACANWFSNTHNWFFNPDNVVFSPRIIELVAGIFNHVFHNPRFATFSPFYAPIVNTAVSCGGQLYTIPLKINNDGLWTYDTKALEEAFEGIDIFILTNPHNPTGRVWSEDELAKIANLAALNDVLIISDDIHCDILREGVKWHPIGMLCLREKNNSAVVSCVSPAKSFNLAGLEAAAAITSDAELRRKMRKSLQLSGIHNPNYFSIPAAISAWNSDGTWMRALNKYIDRNLKFVTNFLQSKAPYIKFYFPEGTYLLWCDASKVISSSISYEYLAQKSHVVISPGDNFGAAWKGYFRIGVAIPRSKLEVAMIRLLSQLQNTRKV